MAIDPETWEQQFPTDTNAIRKRRRVRRSRDRPALTRARDRPRRPRWLGRDDPDQSWRKRPNPLPLAPDPRAYRLLTSVCEDRTALLDIRHARRFRPALLALSAHRRRWVRPPDAWVPPGGDAADQFAGLARHLLALYDPPRFLDTAWLEGLTPDGVTHQGWYAHVAAGRSIRSAPGLPLPLTRRMGHHFMNAPADLDVAAAIRYAQVLGLGGDGRLARSVLASRIGTDFRENDFWESVIRWFVAHPALDPVHHGPVIDYPQTSVIRG